jgi:hypothetical protein
LHISRRIWLRFRQFGQPGAVNLAEQAELFPVHPADLHAKVCRCFFPDRFLGYPVFPQRVAPTTLSSQCILSSSSAFLQSLAQRHLASQPQPTGSSLGLSFPSAHEGSEVHSPRALPARYVPPAGFGYPLGGLRPPSPCRFCFTPAALLGFALRSFLLSQGTRRVSAGVDPHAVSPVGFPAAEAVGRPNGPRLLGFDPCASTWRPDEG